MNAGESRFGDYKGWIEVNCNPLRGAPQCLRWRFPEQRAIGDRKTAKLPKTMMGDNAGDGCLQGLRPQQGAMREVHAAQSEKTDRPHAKMLFAGGAKRSLRD